MGGPPTASPVLGPPIRRPGEGGVPQPLGSGNAGGLRGFVRDNGLGPFFVGAFLLSLVGQAIAGHADFNDQMSVDGLQRGLPRRVRHLVRPRRGRLGEPAVGVAAILPLHRGDGMAAATRFTGAEAGGSGP
ncbi:DUF6766 family protein [Streptomyces sp. NPDC012616]|uniref:DUF6766 family protein n=1 Tax=Streptomyces sp. NPDC012616 TaxID=3364840 RepID=UPI0036ED381B